MKLFDYQTLGVDFLAPAKTALLNWEPGCGKTPVAVCSWEWAEADEVVVLCPAVAKENWRREIRRWGDKNREVVVLTSRSKRVPARGTARRVIVANYDLLTGVSPAWKSLKALAPDVLVLDEAHFLKNVAAIRTKRVLGRDGLAPVSKRVWCLTGTPAPNHYGELYPMIRALYPQAITRNDGYVLSQWAFEDAYCRVSVTPWGRKVQGSKNGKDLAEKLKGFMSTVKKTDVLTDLPPLLFDILPVSPDEIPAESRAEVAAAYEALQAVLDSNPNADALDAVNSAGLALASERRAIGLAKIQFVAKLIKDELDANSQAKRVIFAVHKSIIEGLTAALKAYNPVVIDGGVSAQQRTTAVDRFQNDPACRVFIGNITAAGTAISLTASKDVVFAESSWVPSDNYQAACRCHRVGQRDAVLARMVCLSGTVDERVLTAVAAKSAELAELFG